MIIPDGWFEDKNAELRSNALGDWVLIEGENDFCIDNGRITNLTMGDRAREIEVEVLRIYDLLRARKGAEDPSVG